MRYTRISSHVIRWALPALLIAYATLHRLGQTYGSTFSERHAPFAPRALPFMLGAGLVGSLSAFSTWRSGGLRNCLVSHVATDSCGVTAARFRLGRT
jgi:hypothetical protein